MGPVLHYSTLREDRGNREPLSKNAAGRISPAATLLHGMRSDERILCSNSEKQAAINGETNMSQELQFIETASGEWFYILEQPHAPKDVWDWHDYADAYGPFPTYEAAAEHEYHSDSDTSGSEIVEFNERVPDSAQRLIDACLEQHKRP